MRQMLAACLLRMPQYPPYLRWNFRTIGQSQCISNSAIVLKRNRPNLWRSRSNVSLDRAPNKENPATTETLSLLHTDLLQKCEISSFGRLHKVHDADQIIWSSSGVESIQDDEIIREAFSRKVSNANNTSSRSSGLLGTRDIKNAEDIRPFATKFRKKCEEIVAQIVDMDPHDNPKMVVKLFDRLSENLCRVLDLVEFTRSVHPDAKYADAADETHAQMFEFMNELNTNQRLYEVLRTVRDNKDSFKVLSTEEKAVAEYFLSDFEISGIRLQDADRRKFIELQNTIGRLSRHLAIEDGPQKRTVTFSREQIVGAEGALSALGVPLTSKRFFLPTSGPDFFRLMCLLRSEDTRLALLRENLRSSELRVQHLNELLHTKMELAKLVGYPTYAHLALSTKMAGNPENVVEFLKMQSRKNHGPLTQEFDELLKLKQEDDQSASSIYAWDRLKYATQRVRKTQDIATLAPDLSQYTSLDSIMQGLARVLYCLYGVRLVPVVMSSAETWADDVVRLDVLSEHGERLGIIYMDLFSRERKFSTAAHFTVRCSRRIDDDPVLQSDVEERERTGSAEHEASPDLFRQTSAGQIFQIPTIVVSMDLDGTLGHSSPLTFSDIGTLFHEMGHALHSMLSQTEYQNLAGTRCVTDFVELPSVLMEEFLTSSKIINEVFRHEKTRKPLNVSEERLKFFNKFRTSAIEHQEQINYSMLDQLLHAEDFEDAEYDSTAIYKHIQETIGPFGYLDGTSWQAQFAHLDGYGASYYSYLFDKVLARRVWNKVSLPDPLSRANGERIRNDLLKWGGGRDPWQCLAAILDEPELTVGGVSAMQIVGKWGIGSN